MGKISLATFFVAHASKSPSQPQSSIETPLGLARATLNQISQQYKIKDKSNMNPEADNVISPLCVEEVPLSMIDTSLLDITQESTMQQLHLDASLLEPELEGSLSELEIECLSPDGEASQEAKVSLHADTGYQLVMMDALQHSSYNASQPQQYTSTSSEMFEHEATGSTLNPAQRQEGTAPRKKPQGRTARARANKRRFALSNLDMHGFVRIANLNVQKSLSNRWPLLKAHLIRNKLDVITCTETGTFQPLQLGKGLSFYCAPFRNADSRGVGVVIRDKIPHVELTKSFPVNLIEVAIVGIMLQDVNIALCCLYTPSRLKTITIDRYTEMHELNERLKAQGWSPLWGGDFNAKIGSLPRGIAGNNPAVDLAGSSLLEFTHSSDLYIVNKSPLCEGKWTRVQGSSRSIIDYFLMDIHLVNRLQKMFVDEDKRLFVNSDHNLMWLDLAALPPSSDVGSTLKWNTPSDDQLKAFRSKVALSLTNYVSKCPPLSTTDADAAEVQLNREAEGITEAILQAAESCIGKHTVNSDVDSAPPGVSAKVSAYKVAHAQYKEALRSESRPVQAALWQALNVAREKLDKALRKEADKEAKKLTELARKTKSATPLWKLRANITRRPSSRLAKPVRRSDTADMVTRPPEVKEILTEYASNLYSFHTDSILPEGPDPPNQEYRAHMDCQGLMDPFSTQEISEIIKDLKDMKSPGPDNIPNEFLKAGGPILHAALAILYSRCIVARCTPAVWGEANTIMLFKKGDPSLLDNYRGIAMSDTIGKVFCSALNLRLVPILESHNVFGHLQFGFRRDFRTTDALFTFSHIIETRRQRGEDTFAAFLDLKKAYDVVDRSRLWARLLNIGLPSEFVAVLKSLYNNTITRVQYGNVTSDMIHVESGVKQGCPLSPTLFNIFIAGLITELMESKQGASVGNLVVPALFFADDMVVLAQSEDQLQQLLDIVGTFASKMGLAFNGPKSSILVFSKRQRQEKVWTLEGAPIFEADHAEITENTDYKYLGITTSTHRSPFQSHQAVMVKRLAIDAKVLPTLFVRAPGRPALEDLVWRQVAMAGCLYGAEVMVPNRGTLEALDKIQRIAGRKVLRDRPKSTNEGILGELGWLPMEYRFDERCMNYRARLERMPQDRLVKQVFMQCNNLPEKSDWLQHSDQLFAKYQLDIQNLAAKTSVTCKQVIKGQISKTFIAKWREDQIDKKTRKVKSTMRFMYEGHQPGKFPSFLDGSMAGFWLHRARTDELPLNSRVFPRSVITCPNCPSTKETLEHFLLECPAYEYIRLQFFSKARAECGVNLGDDSMSPKEQLQYILGFNQPKPKGSHTTPNLQAFYIMHLARLRGLTINTKDAQPLEDLEQIIEQWS